MFNRNDDKVKIEYEKKSKPLGGKAVLYTRRTSFCFICLCSLWNRVLDTLLIHSFYTPILAPYKVYVVRSTEYYYVVLPESSVHVQTPPRTAAFFLIGGATTTFISQTS